MTVTRMATGKTAATTIPIVPALRLETVTIAGVIAATLTTMVTTIAGAIVLRGRTATAHTGTDLTTMAGTAMAAFTGGTATHVTGTRPGRSATVTATTMV